MTDDPVLLMVEEEEEIIEEMNDSLSDDHMLVLQVNDLFFFYEFKVFRNYFILKSTTFLLAFS